MNISIVLTHLDPFLLVYVDDGRSKAKYEERPPPLWKTEGIHCLLFSFSYSFPLA